MHYIYNKDCRSSTNFTLCVDLCFTMDRTNRWYCRLYISWFSSCECIVQVGPDLHPLVVLPVLVLLVGQLLHPPLTLPQVLLRVSKPEWRHSSNNRFSFWQDRFKLFLFLFVISKMKETSFSIAIVAIRGKFNQLLEINLY